MQKQHSQPDVSKKFIAYQRKLNREALDLACIYCQDGKAFLTEESPWEHGGSNHQDRSPTNDHGPSLFKAELIHCSMNRSFTRDASQSRQPTIPTKIDQSEFPSAPWKPPLSTPTPPNRLISRAAALVLTLWVPSNDRSMRDVSDNNSHSLPHKRTMSWEKISALSASPQPASSPFSRSRRSSAKYDENEKETRLWDSQRPKGKLKWTKAEALPTRSSFVDAPNMACIATAKTRNRLLQAKTRRSYEGPPSIPSITSLRYEPYDVILQPETRPLSQEQVVDDVKAIYTDLAMVKGKFIEVNIKQAALAQPDPDRQPQLNSEPCQALISLHVTLPHGYLDFFVAPSTGWSTTIQPKQCSAIYGGPDVLQLELHYSQFLKWKKQFDAREYRESVHYKYIDFSATYRTTLLQFDEEHGNLERRRFWTQLSKKSSTAQRQSSLSKWDGEKSIAWVAERLSKYPFMLILYVWISQMKYVLALSLEDATPSTGDSLLDTFTLSITLLGLFIGVLCAREGFRNDVMVVMLIGFNIALFTLGNDERFSAGQLAILEAFVLALNMALLKPRLDRLERTGALTWFMIAFFGCSSAFILDSLLPPVTGRLAYPLMTFAARALPATLVSSLAWISFIEKLGIADSMENGDYDGHIGALLQWLIDTLRHIIHISIELSVPRLLDFWMNHRLGFGRLDAIRGPPLDVEHGVRLPQRDANVPDILGEYPDDF